jgi:hypothetical protein
MASAGLIQGEEDEGNKREQAAADTSSLVQEVLGAVKGYTFGPLNDPAEPFNTAAVAAGFDDGKSAFEWYLRSLRPNDLMALWVISAREKPDFLNKVVSQLQAASFGFKAAAEAARAAAKKASTEGVAG